MTLRETIINRIFQLCEERKITINKMCTICGITQSTINNIVNYSTQTPRVSTIKKICDGLEITLADFFDTDEFNNLEQEIK